MGIGMMMGSGFPPEAQALFARMSTPPSGARKHQISRLIRSLKQAGVWVKLDVFYMFAAANSQAALLNWKSTSYNAANSSATFTADQGYTRGGGAAHISSGYQMGNGQSSVASFGCGVSIRAITGSIDPAIGAAQASVSTCHISASLTRSYLTAGAVVDPGVDVGLSGVAHLSLVKSGAVMSGYRNGLLLGTKPSNLPSAPPYPFYLLATNQSGSAGGIWSGRMAAAYFGSALTADDVAALEAALSTYLTAVGA